jgi:hypothetical protein
MKGGNLIPVILTEDFPVIEELTDLLGAEFLDTGDFKKDIPMFCYQVFGKKFVCIYAPVTGGLCGVTRSLNKIVES